MQKLSTLIAATLVLVIILSGCTSNQQSNQNQIANPPSDNGQNQNIVNNPTNLPNQPTNNSPTTQNLGNGTNLAELEKCEKSYDVNYEQTKCYEKLALTSKDPSICGRIDPGWGESMKCYTDASAYLTESTCEKTTEKEHRYSCLKALAQSKRDASICDKIGEPEVTYRNDKAACYGLVASLLNDSAICETLSNVSGKNSCYYTFGGLKEDMSFCDKIVQNDPYRDQCLSYFAGKDESLITVAFCEKFLTSGYKASCYNGLAIKEEDAKFCDKIIEPESAKIGCYINLATKKKDTTLCDKITEFKPNFSTVGCYARIAREENN